MQTPKFVELGSESPVLIKKVEHKLVSSFVEFLFLFF